jgi:formate/nitrite transporter FocA (FNT family)
MKHLKCFVSGILAGIAIGLGGGIYLTCLATIANGGRIVGSILFSIGLFLVCSLGLNLYTGKIGYVFENRKDYLLSLLEMILGNAGGAIGLGYLLSATSLNKLLAETAQTCSLNKILDLGQGGQSWYSCLINAFFCGVLVFLAVDLYKKSENHLIKVVGLFGCVTAFVALGFEHCIADMFYFAFSNMWGTHFGEAILAMLLFILGNSLGSIAFWAGLKFIKPALAPSAGPAVH